MAFGNMVGGSALGEVAKRQSQVNEALARASARAQSVCELVDKLESRISSVTLAVPPSKETNPNTRTALVPLADGIERVAESLDGSVARLESILSRIEL